MTNEDEVFDGDEFSAADMASAEEDQRLFEEEFSTHGELTTDPELLGRISDAILKCHLDAAQSRCDVAAHARSGLTKALMLPPNSSDVLTQGTANALSLGAYGAAVLEEVAAAGAIMDAYSAEASRRFEAERGSWVD